VQYVFWSPRMKALDPPPSGPLARGPRTGTWSPPAPCSGYFPGAIRRAAEGALAMLAPSIPVDVFQLYWLGKGCPRSTAAVSGRNVPAPGRGEGPRARGLDPRPANGPEIWRRKSILDLLMIRYNAAHPGAEEEIFPRLFPPPPAVGRLHRDGVAGSCFRAPAAGKETVPTAGDCYRFLPREPARGRCAHGPRNWASFGRIWAGP